MGCHIKKEGGSMKTIALIIFFLFFSIPANADEIHFKDGRIIQVENYWEDENSISYMMYGGTITVSKDLIEKTVSKLTEDQTYLIKMQESEKHITGPTTHKETIMAYINRSYFDPYSIQDLRISEPILNILEKNQYGLFAGQKTWIVSMSCNAKNRMGAYTGTKTTFFIFRGDDLLEVLGP
jgi:hypothetical protein